MERKKAWAAGLLAFVVLVTIGLPVALSRNNPPPWPALKDLTHLHIFTPSEVKAAFAKQGIRLREMRTRYGPHVMVLFDPRWHAPTDFRVKGGPPGPPTHIWVYIHANDSASSFDQVGNVYAYGPGEGAMCERVKGGVLALLSSSRGFGSATTRECHPR